MQILLLAFQGIAPLLVGLLPPLPVGPVCHQGIDGRHQPLFIARQGLKLVAQPLGHQGPLASGCQQAIALVAGRGQG